MSVRAMRAMLGLTVAMLCTRAVCPCHGQSTTADEPTATAFAIDPRIPERLQRATIDELFRRDSEAATQRLLGEWLDLTPTMREYVADVLLAKPERVPLVIDAVRAGRVPRWSLTPRHRQMLQSRDAEVTAAVAAVADLTTTYGAALKLAGDSGRGRRVFEYACAQCHRLGTLGKDNFGPDLGTLHTRPPLDVLTDILDPDRLIADQYQVYEITRVGGPSQTGMFDASTDTDIIIRVLATRIAIPRREIVRTRALPHSAMPQGLDALIDPAAMADLLTFVMTPPAR